MTSQYKGNSDATQVAGIEYHKLIALFLIRFGLKVEFTMADVQQLANLGDDIHVVTHTHYDTIECKLVGNDEANAILKKYRESLS